MISAIPSEAGPAEEQSLRGAAVALARATASRYSPLAVVRRQEIVVVVAPDRRVTSLASMSAFEYLTLRPDPTASRLIASPIHEFVAQDSRDGGQLIATLREYVACDLNGKRAAENLHIHVNTAHYRLARIAERTGCDLRRVVDLIEILIAARLADARGPRSDADRRGPDRS